MASSSRTCVSCLRVWQRSSTKARSAQPGLRNSSGAYRTSAATPALYLDFLAPSSLRRYTSSSLLPQCLAARSTVPIRVSQKTYTTAAAAAVATSPNPDQPPPPSNTARAISNPRNGEDGKPMTISISPRAAHRLSSIAASDKNPDSALRITIESGGCHGFQYLMNLVDLSKEPATEEDTVFEGDKGAKVVMDESSLELLNGSTVDYTMELIGSQFKVTGIPGATSSCGCGTSFDIKI